MGQNAHMGKPPVPGRFVPYTLLVIELYIWNLMT